MTGRPAPGLIHDGHWFDPAPLSVRSSGGVHDKGGRIAPALEPDRDAGGDPVRQTEEGCVQRRVEETNERADNPDGRAR